MTDSTLEKARPSQDSLGLTASIAAALIVAAIILAVVKVIGQVGDVERPSLIPLDQPADWSGFSA